MQTNFEKKIKDKLNNFKLEPSQHVWEDVAAALNNQKRRRVFAWWVYAAAGIFILISLSCWLFISNSSMLKKHITSTKKLPQQTVATIPVQPLDPSQKNISFIKDEFTKNKRHDNSAADISKDNVSETNNNELRNFYSDDGKITDIISNNYSINSSKDELSFNPVYPTLAVKKISENSFALSNISKTADKNSITQSNKKNKPKTWFFVISGGTTNTTDKNFLFQTDNLVRYLPNTASPDTLKRMKQAYTGFHITAGVEYRYALTQKWTLYSGLQYSFLLNHQRTGPRQNMTYNISRNFDTTSSQYNRFIKVPYHYNSGTSATLTNHANWLELPLSVGYTVNPESKVKVEIKTGGSLAYMNFDKWLIPDGRYNKFYYSKELTNYYIVNLHADAEVKWAKSKVVGIELEHSLTPLAKTPVQPSVYWSNISIYTTIPLK